VRVCVLCGVQSARGGDIVAASDKDDASAQQASHETDARAPDHAGHSHSLSSPRKGELYWLQASAGTTPAARGSKFVRCARAVCSVRLLIVCVCARAFVCAEARPRRRILERAVEPAAETRAVALAATTVALAVAAAATAAIAVADATYVAIGHANVDVNELCMQMISFAFIMCVNATSK
jgi:hypothetical protein